MTRYPDSAGVNTAVSWNSGAKLVDVAVIASVRSQNDTLIIRRFEP